MSSQSGLSADLLNKLGPEFVDPPSEYSLCPFWFWNDDLDEIEIERQIEDFQAHGVHAFVIHPRVGLPKSIGWMSAILLRYIRFAVECAAKRKMWVVLYDEGMYPSGSSSGQVVAENALFQCRGLELRDAKKPVMPGDQLHLHVEIERQMRGIWKYKAEARVDGLVVAEAKLMCAKRDIQQ